MVGNILNQSNSPRGDMHSYSEGYAHEDYFMQLARRNGEEVGAGKLADNSYEIVVIRPALDLFDMVQESFRLLKPGGVLIIDQVLSNGKVVDPTQRDPESIARRDAVKVIKDDERWSSTVIPVGAGVLVANKLA